MYSSKSRDYFQPRRSSLHVNLSFESSDASDNDLHNISSRQEILDDNVKRLREAILNKTRQIFDNQNDFCKKTATVLGRDSYPNNHNNHNIQNDQNNQNLSNSQERVLKLDAIVEESDSNDFSPKASSSRESRGLKTSKSKNNVIVQPRRRSSTPTTGSPIMTSSKITNSLPLSPRKTRSSSSSNKLDSFMGDPITSSTFTSHNSTVLHNPRAENLQFDSAKSTKPVIRDVRLCQVSLDRIDGYEKVNRSINLREIPMELTPVVRNPVLRTNFCRGDESRTSMEVRTSMDSVQNDLSARSNTDKQGSSPGRARRSLSLNKLRGDVEALLPAPSKETSEVEPSPRRTVDDRLSLDVNTSVGSPRTSINASVVGATPCPVSRSVFLRTQSRMSNLPEKKSLNLERTLAPGGGLTTPLTPTMNAVAGPSTSFARLEDTIVLDTSSLKGPIIKDSSDESEQELDLRKRKITDSSHDERSEEEDNVSTRKKCKKRKLFTQLNNSGIISLSPRSVEPSPQPPTPPPKPISRGRRKKNRKIITQKLIIQEGMETQKEKPMVIKKPAKFPKKIIADNKKEEVKKKRKVTSKKIVLNKKVNPDVLRLLCEVGDEGFDKSEVGRDSLNDFTDNKRIATKGRHHSKCIYIVTTGLCNGDKDLVKAAVMKIGGAKIEASVTRHTTHIITTGVRTINLLRGIIRGCWLVSIRWLKKSFETRTWERPEGYEIEHFSKAVQDNRRDREIFGRSYVPELFATCGLIYIDSGTTPPGDILKELIKTAGGRIIENSQKARIIVGPKGLREVWVLDSITTGELQPLKEYR